MISGPNGKGRRSVEKNALQITAKDVKYQISANQCRSHQITASHFPPLRRVLASGLNPL